MVQIRNIGVATLTTRTMAVQINVAKSTECDIDALFSATYNTSENETFVRNPVNYQSMTNGYRSVVRRVTSPKGYWSERSVKSPVLEPLSLGLGS